MKGKIRYIPERSRDGSWKELRFSASPPARGVVREAALAPESVPVSAADRRFSDGPLTAILSTRAAGEGVRVALVLEPGEPLILGEVEIVLETETGADLRFFANGYQSWTDSREFSPGEAMRGMRPLFSHWSGKYRLAKMGDAFFHRYPRRRGVFHSYTLSYLRRAETDTIRFFGSLGEREGFTLFTWNGRRGSLSVSRDCGGHRIDGTYRGLDFVERRGTIETVFDSYRQDLGIPRQERAILTGWTSWYRHYEKVTEHDVVAALNGFSGSGFPIDLIQIDDGWQNAVGDWLVVNSKFPGGMKDLARRISDAGYLPGLWLAPLVAEGRSILLREHPDWVMRDRGGKPVEAGNNPFNWGGLFYALDLENKEVRGYLVDVFRTIVEEGGYRFLKLDFLYAAALGDSGRETRGGAMARAVDFLREAAGDVPILGCGVPLGSAFGRFEYCRIGSDVALKWEDRRLSFLRYRERVSTINSLASTIGRHPLLGKVFMNDPDVSILRETGHALSLEQRKTLFLLNQLFGGLLLVSDNPAEYGPECRKLYESQFPVRPKRILRVECDRGFCSVDFSIGNGLYRCIANLSSDGRSVRLPEGHWFMDGGILAGGCLVFLPPFASRCLFSVPEHGPAVAGSDRLFPGAETAGVDISGRRVDILLHEKTPKGTVLFVVTPDAGEYLLNGKPSLPFAAVPRPLHRIVL
jgi:alpha-galactosidase